MNRKYKMVLRLVMAAAVAASVAAAPHLADAASASVSSKAVQAVVKAEKLGAALNKEISYEYRKAKYPKAPVGYPNMKLFNDAKLALADAKKMVAPLKGKDKTVLSARLDAHASIAVTRTAEYIDAVTAGLKVQKKGKELITLYEKGVVDGQLDKVSMELKTEINKSSSYIDLVYGATTRAQFRAFYIQPAEKQLSKLSFPLKIRGEMDNANAAIDAGYMEEAAQHLGNVDYFVNEAAKKGQPKTDKLIASLLIKQKAVLAEFEKRDEFFIAKSTNPKAPTTYGPTGVNQLYSKNIYVYAGTNEHLKLQNITIDGNLIILGSPGGAGSVSLENVEVNLGKIAVNNVGGNGFHLKNVQAAEIDMDDSDGFRIVADKGTKITSLNVNGTPGDKAKSTLETLDSGAFSFVTVDSYGTTQNQGIELKGYFSNVEVKGRNVRCALTQSSEVNYINFKAGTELSISSGAKVNRMTKGTYVQGEVKVNNQGAVEKADRNITVAGNAPAQLTAPIAKPGPETGEVLPMVDSFRVMSNFGHYPPATYDPTTDMTTVSMSNLTDWFILQGFEIKSAKAERFQITEVSGDHRYVFPKKNYPIEFAFTNGVLSLAIGDIWPMKELIKSDLQFYFGKFMIIKGDLIDGNNKRNEITLKIAW